eukprot:3931625-Rhodomonas_salina.1
METAKDGGREIAKESKLDLSDQLDSILRHHEETTSPKKKLDSAILSSPRLRLGVTSVRTTLGSPLKAMLSASTSKSPETREEISRVPSDSSTDAPPTKPKPRLKGIAAVVKLGVKASRGKGSKQDLTEDQMRILEGLEVSAMDSRALCDVSNVRS